ncbi:MAG: TonB-dependent receptor plug domain-containing protein, partial [Bacteroidia bacterium]|nr:TonB-dependent receptor plug domain-containing protein [Bacteroidia bacterium]
MLKNFALIFFIVLMSMTSRAQKATVSGVVRAAETGQTLPGASVFANGMAIAVSDMDGFYKVTLDSGKYEISFRFISYQDKKIDIKLTTNEVRELNVSLKESSNELSMVVVSAGKFEQKIEEVTVSMEVMKPKLVEDRNTTSMDDALQQVAGVAIIDGQANIRGGSGWSYGAGSRVQVLVDDLPQLTADANDAKWNFLPVENLEQIEVIKGASSVLFGSSALNGAINIRTAYPKEKPLTKITAFTGVYDHARYTLNDTSYRADWWGSVPQMYNGMNFLHSRQVGRLDVVVGGNMFIDETYRQGEFEQRARINTNLRYRFKKIEGLSAG